jgi:hypothetical protein
MTSSSSSSTWPTWTLSSKPSPVVLLLLNTLIVSQLVPSCMSSHVLLMPFPYRSHVTEISSIGKGLLERGHRVTILLSASYPELEEVRNESGFQVVDYAVVDPDFYTIDYSSSSTPDWVTNALEMDPIDELRNNVEGLCSISLRLTIGYQ